MNDDQTIQALAETEAFLREKADHASKLAKWRRDSAASFRDTDEVAWREAHKLAQLQAGRKWPAMSKAEREDSANRDDRIAAKNDRESVDFLRLADAIADAQLRLTACDALLVAIRAHRDARGDDRCWMDDEELYKALPEGYTPPTRDTAVELARCQQFIASRQHPLTVYISPQREIERLLTALQAVETLRQRWLTHAHDLGGVPESITKMAAIGWLTKCAQDLLAALAPATPEVK